MLFSCFVSSVYMCCVFVAAQNFNCINNYPASTRLLIVENALYRHAISAQFIYANYIEETLSINDSDMTSAVRDITQIDQ